MVRVLQWGSGAVQNSSKALITAAKREKADVCLVQSSGSGNSLRALKNMVQTQKFIAHGGKNPKVGIWLDCCEEGNLDYDGIPNFTDEEMASAELKILNGHNEPVTVVLCSVFAKNICFPKWERLKSRMELLNEYSKNNNLECFFSIGFGTLISERDACLLELKSLSEHLGLSLLQSPGAQLGDSFTLSSSNLFRAFANVTHINNRDRSEFATLIDIWPTALTSGIKVSQLNAAKSLETYNELNIRVSRCEIDILLMQEPPQFKGKLRKIKGGETFSYTTSEKDATAPRASIWARKELCESGNCFPLWEFTDRDTATIEMTLKYKKGNKANVVICSVYMPHNNDEGKYINNPITQTLKNLIDYCKRSKKELILGCDSNAHHKAWSDAKTDTRGNHVLNTVMEDNLIILNNSSCPTYEKGTTSSIIDLTWCSEKIYRLESRPDRQLL